jgi:hypothetical protein
MNRALTAFMVGLVAVTAALVSAAYYSERTHARVDPEPLPLPKRGVEVKTTAVLLDGVKVLDLLPLAEQAKVGVEARFKAQSPNGLPVWRPTTVDQIKADDATTTLLQASGEGTPLLLLRGELTHAVRNPPLLDRFSAIADAHLRSCGASLDPGSAARERVRCCSRRTTDQEPPTSAPYQPHRNSLTLILPPRCC